jgi:hypothetical protein
MLSALPTPSAPVAARNTMKPRLKNENIPCTILLFLGSSAPPAADAVGYELLAADGAAGGALADSLRKEIH